MAAIGWIIFMYTIHKEILVQEVHVQAYSLNKLLNNCLDIMV